MYYHYPLYMSYSWPGTRQSGAGEGLPERPQPDVGEDGPWLRTNGAVYL